MRRAGSLLRWLLLRSTGAGCLGSVVVYGLNFLTAYRTFLDKDQTCVPCIGRQILNHRGNLASGFLGCFHLYTIVNNAVITQLYTYLFSILLSNLWDAYPEVKLSEIAESYGNYIFSFLMKFHTLFSSVPFYIPTSHDNFFISTPTLCFCFCVCGLFF